MPRQFGVRQPRAGTYPMIQGIATQNELLAAWAVCRAARDTWLVGDPLRFVDFDALGAPPEVNSWSH